jgi:ADP-heptose:LPS heptosyltransferase
MTDYLKLIYFLLRPNTVFIRKRSGAMGDDLLITLVLPFLREKYPKHKFVLEVNWKDHFYNNPYVDWITDKHIKTTKRHIKPKYLIKFETKTSIYEQFMQSVGGSGENYPELFLKEQELQEARQRINEPYIVICPHGKQKFSSNRKEWGIENFQKLRNLLAGHTFVQIGVKDDPLLQNVIDCRGLKIRQSASLIKNSLFFVGLEGGLMHLAKAVGQKSVIIYGGFIRPEISAYKGNINISNLVDCSPCFHSDKKHDICDTMKCMAGISPEKVYGEIKMKFL